jgi:hypothetical protein
MIYVGVLREGSYGWRGWRGWEAGGGELRISRISRMARNAARCIMRDALSRSHVDHTTQSYDRRV